MGMIAVSANGSRYLNSILIPKNHAIPCREVRPYQVHAQGGRQTTVSVFVTQGESEDPNNCSFVGKYVIAGITPPSVGPAIIDIAYTYDRSGVVNVSASERSTGRVLSVVKEPVPDDMSWVSQPPPKTRTRHKVVYVAVDLSGSMSGQPLRDAQAAVRTFVERSDLSHTSIGLISFADRVKVDHPATQDGRRLARAVAAWSIGGDLGYGNDADPFRLALEQLGRGDSARYLVVLTDGVWSYQAEAKERARACHKAGIEVIAIGFGGADERFLKEIATSDEAALYAESGGLDSAFGDIAQVLLESDGGSVSAGLSWIRRR
jgi:Mg-chelatase subunit ChlD